ncbi:unnamed protein product [Durusdinium trenchii]|uniref:Uncharacterized protein n=1 Tax=Durusdinium trenchii TaxID=1381693 RepID=A0ABP0JX34_9DINO
MPTGTNKLKHEPGVGWSMLQLLHPQPAMVPVMLLWPVFSSASINANWSMNREVCNLFTKQQWCKRLLLQGGSLLLQHGSLLPIRIRQLSCTRMTCVVIAIATASSAPWLVIQSWTRGPSGCTPARCSQPVRAEQAKAASAYLFEESRRCHSGHCRTKETLAQSSLLVVLVRGFPCLGGSGWLGPVVVLPSSLRLLLKGVVWLGGIFFNQICE